MNRHARQRGYLLVELLGVVILAIAFLAISGLVLKTTLRVTRDAQVGQEQHRIEARVKKILRADAWAAYEIRVGDDATLLIRQNEERSVVWQVLDDDPPADGGPPTHSIRRTSFDGRTKLDERTWPLQHDRMTFTLDGVVLVVTRDGASLGPERELRLYSQMAVFSGAVGGGDAR
ncbi:MAG: hypothetical protein GC159_04720 [Phycisphaera sp.]|nr:hypothetical protein [Phycisphaera sp.]